MADRRRPITGAQIKDSTITSTDISGSIISGQSLISTVDTSNDHLLILDATDGALKKVAPTNLGIGGGGGGGGDDTFAMTFRVVVTDTMYNNKYYVKQFWNTDTYGGNSNSRITDTDLATRNWLWIYGYHSAGIVPVDCTLTAYAASGVKWNNGNDANANFYIWKAAAPSNQTHAGDNGSNSIITSFEIDANSDDTFKNTGTVSSGNSFSAGDVVFFAFKAATATTSQADHYMHIALNFTTS